MYIVWKYKINSHLLQNRHKKTCQRLALYLFLKLVQINYIFSDNVCILYIYLIKFVNDIRGHHGCDHMVAALTTTCAISAYLSCQFELLSWWDVLDTTLCDQVWENHQSGKSLWQTVSPNVVSSTPSQQQDSNSQHLVVIHIHCTGTCKSNYHKITTTTAL